MAENYDELLRRADYARTNPLAVKSSGKDRLIEEMDAAIRALQAENERLRENAEALDALEAWGAPEADSCNIAWFGGKGGIYVRLSGVGTYAHEGYLPLHKAIRAALAQAEGRHGTPS